MCVNRSTGWAIWLNDEVVEFQDSVRDCFSLDSAAYCYVLLPCHPCYFIPCYNDQKRSSYHLGVPRLCPSISAYRARSFSHPGVSPLCPKITSFPSETPPPSGSYCMTLSHNSIFLLASCETNVKVSRSCFSVTSWRHQASLLRPPPL